MYETVNQDLLSAQDDSGAYRKTSRTCQGVAAHMALPGCSHLAGPCQHSTRSANSWRQPGPHGSCCVMLTALEQPKAAQPVHLDLHLDQLHRVPFLPNLMSLLQSRPAPALEVSARVFSCSL